jgi:hypothetical protein
VGWEEARREAYEAGALEAITSVLTKHKADPAVLSASTGCLTSIASDPKYAGDLARSGALVGMLNAVEEQPDAKEGVEETLQLLETVATFNAQALLEAGGADAVVRLLRKAGSANPRIAKTCMVSLELINKCPEGGQALRDSGVVPDLLDMVKRPLPEKTDGTEVLMVEACFRLMDRMSRSTEHSAYIREKCDGMQVLSQSLEIHSKNERLCKAGGRLLTKLAAGNVGELIERMNSTTDPKQKEFLASMLANLAIEEETAERIVASGGVSALLTTLSADNPKVIASSARAIARIAADPDHSRDLVLNGAVKNIVDVMKKHAGDPDIAAAVTPTLLKLASSPDNAEEIAEQGGVDVVLSALAAHVDNAETVSGALAFFENLGTQDYDLSSLTDASETVCKCLKAHPEHEGVQLDGLRVLVMLASSESNVDDIVGEDGIDLAMKAINVAADAVDDRKHRGPSDKVINRKYVDKLISTAFYLVSSLCVVDGHRLAICNNQDNVNELLHAVALFGKDPLVRDSANEILEYISDEELLNETWKNLEASVAALLSSKTPGDAAHVEQWILKCAALAMLPENAEDLVRQSSANLADGKEDGSGLGILVRAINAVASNAGIPRQEHLLSAASQALFGISDSVESDPDLRESLGESGAVEAVIGYMGKHPKLTTAVRSGINFLQNFSTIDACAQRITEEHGIEACTALLRANETDVAIIGPAVETLLQLSRTDEGAVAVAKHGGTRQLINTLESNLNTPGFAPAMASCLTLLHRVSMTPQGAEVLAKQGAVDAILGAADKLNSTSTHSAQGGAVANVTVVTQVTDMTTKMLSRLLTEDDVHTTLDDFEELAKTAKAGRAPPVESVRPILAKFGHLSTVGTFTEAIRDREGLTTLASVLTAVVLSESTSEEDLRGILPTAFTALNNVSKGATIPEDLDLAEVVVRSLESGIAVNECLRCVAAVCKDPKVAERILADGDHVLDLIGNLAKSNTGSAETISACFAALSSLAGHASLSSRVGNSPGYSAAHSFLDDSDTTTDSKAVAEALGVVASVVKRSGEHAKKMVSSGGVELMKQVLTTQTIDKRSGNAEALGRAVMVLEGIVAHGGVEAMEAVRTSGAIKKVVRAVESHAEYVSTPESMSATMSFFQQCAESDVSSVEEIVAAGGNELVIAGMNKNGTSVEIVQAGAKALSKLGTGAEAGRVCVEEVVSLSSTVESADIVTMDDVKALGASVQKLGNLVLLEGVVSGKNASSVMDSLSRAVALMAESEVASAEEMAAGVQSIGRVAGMGLVEKIDESILEQVLDIMSMSENNAVVRNSSIHTLAQLAKAGGMGAVTLMSELGAVEAIRETQRINTGDSELQSLASEAIATITGTIVEHTPALVAKAGGAEIILSVVAANAQDPTALASCVESLATSGSGREAVWSVLSATAAHPPGSEGSVLSQGVASDITTETVRVLVQSLAAEAAATGVPASFVGNAEKMSGLSMALTKAVEMQSSLTEQSDQRSRVIALRLAEDALGLLAACAPSADGATAFSTGGGLRSLVGLLEANLGDPETTATLLGVLTNLSKTGSPQVAEALSRPEIMSVVVNSLKMHPADETICADVTEIALSVVKQQGAEGSGLDREALRIIADAQSDHAASARVQTATTSLLNEMAKLYNDEPSKLLNKTLQSASESISKALQFETRVTDSGSIVYVDSTTGVETADAPTVLKAVQASIAAAAETARAQSEDTVMTADTAVVASICQAMERFSQSEEIAAGAAETLSTLSLNDRNTAIIAENGGIRAIIAAVRAQPDKVALVKLLLVLLERISRNDEYKGIVAREGGIDVVVSIAINRHFRDEALATRALATIANLAFNSDENITAIVAANGISAIEKCMQCHRSKPRTLEAAVCALSNIMYADDDIKITVGQTVGDELTVLVDDFATSDAPLVKMALRALGNCTYSEQNVRYVAVENHATAAIVKAMRSFKTDAELLQIAAEVLANFASLEEEGPPEGLTALQQAEWVTVQRMVYDEEGAKEVLEAMKRNQTNTAVVKACLDAIHNICSDLEVSADMVSEMPVIPTIIDFGRQFDWDADLLEHLLPLMASLAESPDAAKIIAAGDGIPVIVGAMDQHGEESHDLLYAGQMALSSLAAHDEARQAFLNSNTHASVIRAIEHHSSNKLFVTEALTTLTRMCGLDKLSERVAEDGLHIVMGVAEDYRYDEELLTSCLRLITHLSFVEANLKAIIQAGGLNLLVNAVVEHPDSRALVLRAVRGIDAIAMSSKENAALTIEEGGQDLLEDVQESYMDDVEIQRACKSAILSMSALDQLKKSEAISHRADRAHRKKRQEGSEDPLAGVRTKLAAGRVLNVWTKGSAKPAHVLVAPDFRSIVWQDPRTKDKLGAMDLRSVLGVSPGLGPDHKQRFLGRKAEETKCFCVEGERSTLCLEANNLGQRDEWVEAFGKLYQVFKTNPTALG